MGSRIIEALATIRFGWTVLLPVAAAICWVGLISPAIARLFGVRLAFSFWNFKGHNRDLTMPQYVFGLGTFSFGVGIFLLLAGHQFVQFILGNKYTDISFGNMSLLVAISLASGTVICWLERLREAAFGNTR